MQRSAPRSGANSSAPLILLVDDETPSRNATGMALRHLGYSVEAVDGADAALAIFDPTRHALVLTDNRMPGRSGVELAEEVRRRAPKIPIVLYTGFAPPTAAAVDRLLEKPVQLDELAATLCALLDGSSSAQA